ncbi:acyl-CoA--6-aminopenicillanic acid acyltransferase [Virgibacillus sp. MSP4-1]|uniref:C45 family autoproteolytic acyltransferase/hydolase n=1 Tax=Virgibacillus sp. MSP4-1 TaxID=2700081 RepID=UPI0005C4A86E|nr:C45 family peptidase [Virgibacillus sp. MSP4-1]QHS21887.1 acyl-CoA--6-aminopenicillanic acid acyltransferase [Virgibacillus sp. MSP4-1]
MKQVYTDIFQYRGSHYDFGYQQGEWLKNSPILSKREQQLGSKKERHFKIDRDQVMAAIKTFIPGVLEEIHGLADALEMNMEETLREFGGYYLEYGKSGCSIFAGKDYLIRNYDSHPVSYEGRYMLYQPTDGGYATLGPAMQITGRMDGMNEKGLVMGYNFVHRKKGEDGFICNMIGRIILETCANVEEGIQVLKELPHRHSFNYVLLDSTGKRVVVEASPRSVSYRKSNISTNHFELITEENRYRTDESRERKMNILSQGEELEDGYQAFRMMNDSEQGVFSSKYDAWAGTLHTAAYFPEDMKAAFAIGADRYPVIFDFSKWLKGDRVNVKKVKGQLEPDVPFLNMHE